MKMLSIGLLICLSAASTEAANCKIRYCFDTSGGGSNHSEDAPECGAWFGDPVPKDNILRCFENALHWARLDSDKSDFLHELRSEGREVSETSVLSAKYVEWVFDESFWTLETRGLVNESTPQLTALSPSEVRDFRVHPIILDASSELCEAKVERSRAISYETGSGNKAERRDRIITRHGIYTNSVGLCQSFAQALLKASRNSYYNIETRIVELNFASRPVELGAEKKEIDLILEEGPTAKGRL